MDFTKKSKEIMLNNFYPSDSGWRLAADKAAAEINEIHKNKLAEEYVFLSAMAFQIYAEQDRSYMLGVIEDRAAKL